MNDDIALDPLAGTLQGVIIDLPWPHKDLNPNARIHHHALARLKKSYRADCYLLTKAAKAKIGEGRHRLDLVFFPPDARKRDRDNLLASVKAALDGMADALGVNDSVFDPVSVSLSPSKRWPGLGLVRIQITPHSEQPCTQQS